MGAKPVLLKWDGFLAKLDFQNERVSLMEQIRVLEGERLANRTRNRERLRAHVLRHGPLVPGANPVPWPKHKERLELQLQAQLMVLKLCMGCTDDPVLLRARLKAARDRVAPAILYETQVRDFLRAKNKKIGWMLVRLDDYLGPDLAPTAEWGRSSLPPEGAAYEAALAECRAHDVPYVAAGAPPPEPEFAADSRVALYEAHMVDTVGRWLPALVDRLVERNPRIAKLKIDPALLRAASWHAARALAGRETRLKSLREVAANVLRKPRGEEFLVEHARYVAAWKVVARAVMRALASELVRRYVMGEPLA